MSTHADPLYRCLLSCCCCACSCQVSLTETFTDGEPHMLPAPARSNVGLRGDDDPYVPPRAIQATVLSWNPVAPPASTFDIPSYCTCK